MFMCEWHYEMYNKPVIGINRPPGAPEDWRPSLMDCVRHGEIAIAFERRHEIQPASLPVDFWDRYWRNYGIQRGFTPSQRRQLQTLVMLDSEACRALTSYDGKGEG
jgi:hypothetical protein